MNPFRSDASKKLKEGIPDDDQTLKESSAGAASLRSGIKQTHSVRRLPSKKDLTEQLQVSTKALDKAKKETYQKKFQLWSKFSLLYLVHFLRKLKIASFSAFL